ncbi:MAG: UvrD-helicase domain-containing protein [Gammaproteobacteria bacterium]|nr:UvrD-helicase domain-containing protein [Gammaproteobacteria bacterium]
MSGLNPQQLRAVRHTSGPLLVLAGAGSGKTSVITQKIAHLVHHHQISPRNVFAVTFTNKAAAEMRERAGNLMDKEQAQQLNVSTFHTLGLRFLAEEGKHLGLRKGMTIMDPTDCLGAIKTLRSEDSMHGPGEDEDIRNRISMLKNMGVSAELALANAGDLSEQYIARVYSRYDELIRAYNAVDFDDLIVLPTKLLRENADVREKWQNRVRYLLVDEYQDTNITQYELVRLLVGIRGQLTAVGDDDQSIYAWRGARPENLAALQTDFRNLTLIKLEQNYRSTERILRAANELIAHNPHEFNKALWSNNGEGEHLKIVQCANGHDETDWVAASILNHKLRYRTKFKDYAVLFRGKQLVRSLERAMREKDIPYRVAGTQSFFDRPEVKDCLAYLRIAANPADDTALLRVINTPKRQIGSATLEKLGNFAHEVHTSLFEAAKHRACRQVLGDATYERVRQFVQTIDDIRYKSLSMSVADAMASMLESIDYNGWIRETTDSQAAGDKRIENVNELLMWMKRIAEKSLEKATLEGIANHLSLVDMLDRQNDEEDSDSVALMTLHASKGLEFPHVTIIGFEEDILPHRNSIDQDTVEEERRLAYVGLTRGRKTVTLTHTRYRTKLGKPVPSKVSRFLEELPQDDLKFLGYDSVEQSGEDKKQSALDNLAAIEALLNPK